MDQKARTILTKCMMMTTSEHDGEILSAIQKANAILAQHNLNWEDLLSSIADRSYMTPPSKRPSTKSSTVRPSQWDNVNAKSAKENEHNDSDDIDKLFEQAYENTPPGSSFYEFIESVHTFWTERGYLTAKQYQAIKRSAR